MVAVSGRAGTQKGDGSGSKSACVNIAELRVLAEMVDDRRYTYVRECAQ